MLIWKEWKKTVRSIAFVIMTVVLVVFVYSQGALFFNQEDIIEEPQPGQSYGMKNVDDPALIMPAALQDLYGSFMAGEYTAYPIGFYKNVRLSEKEQGKMAEILSDLSGISADELLRRTKDGDGKPEGNQIQIDGANQSFNANGQASIVVPEQQRPDQEVSLREGLTYEAFRANMEQADRLIGGGSSFALDHLVRFGKTPVSYEEAMQQYEAVKTKDHFTGAYARLFSDYMGICVSILPVFLAIALCLKDRSSRMEQLVFSRKGSSARLVLSRYAALVAAVMLPVIVLAYVSNASAWALYPGETLNYLAPLAYCFGWLLPSVMISTAIGMLLTELTGTPVAVLVYGMWWFLETLGGSNALTGPTKLFTLTPRHNSMETITIFYDSLSTLVVNRLIITALSLALLGLTVLIYEQKRRGNLHGTKAYDRIKSWLSGLVNRKNRSAA